MATNMDEEQSLRECEAYVQMHGEQGWRGSVRGLSGVCQGSVRGGFLNRDRVRGISTINRISGGGEKEYLEYTQLSLMTNVRITSHTVL